MENFDKALLQLKKETRKTKTDKLITIRVDAETRHKLKIKTANEGVTISSILKTFINSYLYE